MQKPGRFKSQLETSALSGLSVAERLALQASNVALGSVINLVFPILYVHHGNKELTLS